jgi:hypothetical protein
LPRLYKVYSVENDHAFANFRLVVDELAAFLITTPDP